MNTDVVVAMAGTVLTTAVAIYAICDVRNKAKKIVSLGRDLAYLKIKNDLVWEFIEPTEAAYTLEIAKGLHDFGLLAQAANPAATPATIKPAVQTEALEFAEAPVNSRKPT